MRALDRKLLRDLWRLKMPLGAIALVMAAGIGALVMALSTTSSLQRARQTYYDDRRFADVFAQLKRVPESLEAQLSGIPGVALVQTRVVHDVNLSIPGVVEPGSARIVSIPDHGEPALNALHLRRGRLPERGRAGEVLASEAFAQANGLGPGDTLGAVINGRWQTLTVVGIALAPEFVFYVRPGEMLPDDARTAVLWMVRSDVARAVGMEGAFNDVAVRLRPGASAQRVIADLDALLDPYGGLGAYDRSEHISDRYLTDEFNQLAVMGSITPAIFLSVGAFLANVVLGRLVRTQREQLATLKAFGYSGISLARHVLLMAGALALACTVLGIVVGWALGVLLTTMYTEMFRFPVLLFRPDPGAIVIAALVALASCGLGALAALRWTLRLAPAEAMRPELPPEFRQSAIERRVGHGLPVRWRMILRSVESHPWRSVLAVLGVSMSAAVLVVSNFTLDAIEHMIAREYFASQRYDTLVVFNEPASEAALWSLQGALAGDAVLRAEPFRTVAARIGAAHRSRRVPIVGLAPDAQLLRLLDEDGTGIVLPPDGLVLSENLAALLRVGPGSRVRVHILEGRRRELELMVSGVFRGYVGLGAYMHQEALHRALQESAQISGAYLHTDSHLAGALAQRLKLMPRVASAREKTGTIEAFRDTIAEHITLITTLHALFAGIIAFGVVYNTARIAFAERQRELATLRVLGFTRASVSSLLLGEIALLVALGVPLGLLIGRAMAGWLVDALQTESYVFPLIIAPRTYAFAAVVTVLAAVGSAWVVRRGVARLDLLSTLKNVG